MTLSLVPWVLRMAKLSSVRSTFSSTMPSVLCTARRARPWQLPDRRALTQDGDLQRTVGLCAVAYHAGDVAHHVLDGAAHLVVAAAQQVAMPQAAPWQQPLRRKGCSGGQILP